MTRALVGLRCFLAAFAPPFLTAHNSSSPWSLLAQVLYGHNSKISGEVIHAHVRLRYVENTYNANRYMVRCADILITLNVIYVQKYNLQGGRDVGGCA